MLVLMGLVRLLIVVLHSVGNLLAFLDVSLYA